MSRLMDQPKGKGIFAALRAMERSFPRPGSVSGGKTGGTFRNSHESPSGAQRSSLTGKGRERIGADQAVWVSKPITGEVGAHQRNLAGAISRFARGIKGQRERKKVFSKSYIRGRSSRSSGEGTERYGLGGFLKRASRKSI